MHASTQTKLVAIGLTLVAVFHVLLGLLFLLAASSGAVHRLWVGLIAIALGGLAGWYARRLWRRGQSLSPNILRHDILALAQRHSGEFSHSELGAQFAERVDAAHALLMVMTEAGDCRVVDKQGVPHYLFEALLPRIALRRCQFCQAELPLDSTLSACPQCGGTIQSGAVRVSTADADFFAMDEKS